MNHVRYRIADCSLGNVLVAATDAGVCALTLGDDPATLVADLRDRFPAVAPGGPDLDDLTEAAVRTVDGPTVGHELPLDVRGTAFQKRVWAELRRIPPGETATYTDIAGRLGQPTAARAVAGACAANPVAVVVPCHRVVRTDGSLSGYRWGVGRKAELLRREQVTSSSTGCRSRNVAGRWRSKPSGSGALS